MSEELGPLLCELVGELVDFEIDALSKDPRSAKPPVDVTGEDAQSFDFIAYHELYKDKMPILHSIVTSVICPLKVT